MMDLWKMGTAVMSSKPWSCAKVVPPMMLKVRCNKAVCGGRKIRQPLSVAMLKSPLLNGSAMLALLGTLSKIWHSWHRLCHVQCDPIKLLSG